MTAPCVPDRPYLTISDITKTGLTSRTTLWREIRAGRLEAIQIGRAVRIPRDAFERWYDAHRVKAEVASVAKSLTDSERLELMTLLAAK